MMHPFGTVVGLFEDALESWQGPWGQWLHSLEFYETDESRGFVRGAKWGLQPTGAPLSMTTSYPWGAENPIWGPGFHEDFAKPLRPLGDVGDHRRGPARRRPTASCSATAPTGTGSRGAKIVYRMSENSTRLMHFHEERAAESLQAAGAYETVIAPQIRATGWHLLGTAKMGDGPGDLRGRRLGPHPRRAEPVRLRRLALADVGGDEPDGDDRRAGAAHRPRR